MLTHLQRAAFTEATSYANGWYDPTADRYTRAMLAGQPSHSAQSGPSRRAPYQSASDHVQNQTRRPIVGKLRLFPSLKPRFAPIPVWPTPYLTMAVGNEFLGRYEQGISNLKQAIRISPRDSYIGIWYMQMGRELLALGQYDGAIEEGLKAVDSGYRTVLSYTALAAFYAGAGRAPEAKAALAEAMKLNSQALVGVVSRAQLCLGRHDARFP